MMSWYFEIFAMPIFWMKRADDGALKIPELASFFHKSICRIHALVPTDSVGTPFGLVYVLSLVKATIPGDFLVCITYLFRNILESVLTFN